MSACAIELDLAEISYPRSRAVGGAAAVVQQQELGIERAAPGFFAKLHAALASLLAVAAESDAPDWDGHEAEAVNRESVRYASLLLREVLLIQPTIPHVTIDPDGEVAFEWRRSRHRLFSVSVGARGELTYAGLFDGSSVHGVETRMVDGLPREIRAGIQRVYTSR
jgi:hypothetical protein